MTDKNLIYCGYCEEKKNHYEIGYSKDLNLSCDSCYQSHGIKKIVKNIYWSLFYLTAIIGVISLFVINIIN